MPTITLKCACGSVHGEATDITPKSINRVVCCCSDCQAFADYLNDNVAAAHRGSALENHPKTLDQFGGTEICQMSQSQVKIHSGHEHLRSMRLSKKGLLRWYAGCCNTPVANTMSAKIPFAGIMHSFMVVPDPDAVLGPIKAYVQTQHAKGEPDYPTHSAKFPLGITLSIVKKMLVWKIQGKQKPSVFFGDDGRPAAKPEIVNLG